MYIFNDEKSFQKYASKCRLFIFYNVVHCGNNIIATQFSCYHFIFFIYTRSFHAITTPETFVYFLYKGRHSKFLLILWRSILQLFLNLYCFLDTINKLEVAYCRLYSTSFFSKNLSIFIFDHKLSVWVVSIDLFKLYHVNDNYKWHA